MSSSTVVHVKSEAEFSKFLTNKNQPFIVDFTAKWCGPCKTIAPVYEALSKKYPQIKFLKVDVDELPTVAQLNGNGLPEHIGITAMPTFQLFQNGNRVAEVKGANPAALEDLIKKNSSSAPTVNDNLFGITGNVNLEPFIYKSQVGCLNYMSGYELSQILNPSAKTLLQSDCDEQLLLTIQFSQSVKIHSIKFNAPAENGPKVLKLYLNRPNIGFDDVDFIEATQTLTLTKEDFAPEKATALRFVKFQNVQSVTLFFESNQNDSDVTALQSVIFIGQPLQQTEDLKNLKKQTDE